MSKTAEDQSKNSSMMFRVRQDRLKIADLRFFLKIENKQFEVINYSTFGIAIDGGQSWELGDIVEKAELILEGRCITELSLRVTRLEKNGGLKTAFETVSQSVPTLVLSIFPEVWGQISTLKSDHEKWNEVPQDFRLRVYEVESYLDQVKASIERLSNKEFDSRDERTEFEETVISLYAPEMNHTIKEANLYLEGISKKMDPEILKTGLSFFRKRLKRLIFKSPFAKRSYEKPLGYAGDYEMMNKIYRNEAEGEDLFSRCMEKAMQLHSEPQAVRNRSTYLLNKLMSLKHTFKEGKIRILSVACGPAFEIYRLIENCTQEELDRYEITLLDQDQNALKFAQKNIMQRALSEGKKLTLELLLKPVKQVIVEGLPHEPFHFIYSAGLFDYFTDPVATRAAKILDLALVKGGNLVIGNFNIETPNQFGMLTLFDWPLILRSNTDLMRIFSFAESRMTIEQEENEVNLFCVIEK